MLIVLLCLSAIDKFLATCQIQSFIGFHYSLKNKMIRDDPEMIQIVQIKIRKHKRTHFEIDDSQFRISFDVMKQNGYLYLKYNGTLTSSKYKSWNGLSKEEIAPIQLIEPSSNRYTLKKELTHGTGPFYLKCLPYGQSFEVNGNEIDNSISK
eukprot:NODE_342_length_9153_cov_0.637376.p6 type:complete len:152 gc:universal NODE_342_length_9153_cov_0.637376:7473-7018(-)